MRRPLFVATLTRMSPLYTRDAEQFEVPERLPVLPLRDLVLFPYVVTPLLVGRPATMAALEAAVADDRWILLVAQRAAEVEEPAAADLHRTGVVGRVLQFNRLPNGTAKVVVEGVESTAQLALLVEWGCDLYQGFLGAGALTHEELTRFVAAAQVEAA